MIARLWFCLRYFAFWMGYQAILRLVFLVYHHAEAARAGFGTVIGIVTHGARMDLPIAAFPCLIVFPLVALSAFAPKISGRLILALSLIIMVIEALLTAIDAEIFRAWGFRLDGSVVQYLATPREMFASVGSSPVVLLAAIFLALAALSSWAFVKLVWPSLRRLEPIGFPRSLAAIPLASILVLSLYVPLHGGTQKHPIKQSTVSFSHNAFANQAAINVTWTFLDGLWQKTYRTDNPDQYLSTAEATRIVDSLLAPGNGPPRRLLRIARPNVMIILWESWTAKVVEALGGVKGVTPNVSQLVHEGILFDHFYATGERSPKGLTGVISGYPAQPVTEIIKFPRKGATLPALPHDFAAAGYRSAFYYGGDPAFGEFKSFTLASGFDSLITEDAFDPRDRHSHWGADDHVVLARALSDLKQMQRPFFVTLFTLSSHEPFTVPMATVIPGSDEQSLFLNSHAYTDRSIGEFIRRAKGESWWDSTLIVIVADHGHRLPVLDSLQSMRKWELYSIPMLWLGGALAVRDTVITQVGTQTDIPATLLHQLGFDASKYTWSRDLLAPGTRSWAWFTFRDGFGFVNQDGGTLAWDNIGRRLISEQGKTHPGDVRSGEALMQRLVDDYLRR